MPYFGPTSGSVAMKRSSSSATKAWPSALGWASMGCTAIHQEVRFFQPRSFITSW